MVGCLWSCTNRCASYPHSCLHQGLTFAHNGQVMVVVSEPHGAAVYAAGDCDVAMERLRAIKQPI